MNSRIIKKYFITCAAKAIAASTAMQLASCHDEHIYHDYCRAGEDVEVTVALDLPEMHIATRADLSEHQLNQVESLWVRSYSSDTGEATSEWLKLEPSTDDIETAHKITLKSKSGPSYIVAVANVDNYGVLRSDISTRKLLSELLDAADTWSKFLDIAVESPSSYLDVNAPSAPLPMCGAYTNLKVGHGNLPRDPGAWGKENFIQYTIPWSDNGKVNLTDGAIHLRRLVSHITFNLTAGDDVNITPTGYSVVNVPRYSWLYERDAMRDGFTENFGDVCTIDNRADYYSSPQGYPASNIDAVPGGGYTFNFWQGENKHTGSELCTEYGMRDKQNIENGTNNGIFTFLSGDTWTPNNMATYVKITCSIEHKGQIKVDNDGVITPETGEDVYRSATATFYVHLGYMKADPRDFNCYRNTDCTYNVRINGVNNIRVEAFNHGETPGAEGVVSDVANPTISLDCHYGVFNVQLSDKELQKWEEKPDGTSTGFGFITITYDNLNGGEKRYQETDFRNRTFDQLSDEEKRYLDWVELRPTTDDKTLSAYKPRGTYNGGDGLTFNLLDAAKGISELQKSSSGWYTVFVREYSYDFTGDNEETFINGKPQWQSYVNAPPRRFFIRVTRSVSEDGASIYARSKYAAVQQSIMSYYTTATITEKQNDSQVRGAAVGIEHTNETFGLNMRCSYTHLGSESSGRHNCWRFAHCTYSNNNGWTYAGSAPDWKYVYDSTRQQSVPAATSTHNSALLTTPRTERVPALAAYRPSSQNRSAYDPLANSRTTSDYIEAINACMNRNRDNNGDGKIDASELRWYVPTLAKYLRIVIGAHSLGSNAIVDYESVDKMPYSANHNCGEYIFFCSDGISDGSVKGRILWAMEGFSSSPWGSYNAVAPWQVRCIRNLGTDLSSVNEKDRTVPAYAVDTSESNIRVYPTYYNIANVRVTPYSGNGTAGGQMPVHSMADSHYNSIYRGGFEINSETYNTYNTGSYDNWVKLAMGINNASVNPCNALGGDWRLPNVSELAIMRNLGLITKNSYLSCTMAPFASGGAKVTPEGITASTSTTPERYFLNAVTTHITQAFPTTRLVRCVRDIH